MWACWDGGYNIKSVKLGDASLAPPPPPRPKAFQIKVRPEKKRKQNLKKTLMGMEHFTPIQIPKG